MSDNSNGAVEPVELYRKHRPSVFRQVFGQDEAVSILDRLLRQKKLPHVLLFTGPSGVGKTTLCRILKKKLGCSDPDYQEVNCAAIESPMEKVREIEQRMGLSPWGGSCRIWLLDEVQSLSRTTFAQQALLKMLEDTPKHVYFFLATTNPEKVIKTIQTRCTRIDLSPLPPKDLRAMLEQVYKKEGIEEVSDKVLDRIVDVADGSGREALVQLNKALSRETEREQLEAVQRSGTVQKAFDLVRALLWTHPKPKTWKELASIISGIDDGEDWEGVRRMILSIATKEMLKPGGNAARAHSIVSGFRDDWYACGKAGLIDACWGVIHPE